MKSLYIIAMLLCPVLYTHAQTLSGRVIDSATKESIPGAVVYIHQLKTGATADTGGYYQITDIPNGTYSVEAEYLGYVTAVKVIKVEDPTTFNFQLASTPTNMRDIVITALGNKTTRLRSPVPVSVVSHDMLVQGTSTNVIDAISLQPGMSEITTGPGVSKPEINGLGYNRVLTLLDGERQEDFQWGDEHGILIDPYSVYNAEIIRGPASLQYGANAVAGVVSFRSEPLPENGNIQGSVLSEYQTNNGLIGNSFDIGGNHHGFTWDVRASMEEAHCYWDPRDGYVWGTAFTQNNIRAVLGWNKKWGYSHFTVSLLNRQTEIPDGNRDSATRQFEFDVPLNATYLNGAYVPGSGQIYPTRANFLSYKPDISGYQVLHHNVVWWQNSINAGAGRVGVDIGYSQSGRHEVDTGNVAQLNMTVNDIPYSLKYQVEGDQSGIKLTTGINGMYEFMKNGAEPPAPYIGDFSIPDYHLFDIGGYVILQKDLEKLTLLGGLRYDMRMMTAQAMYLADYHTPSQHQIPAANADAYTQFAPFHNSYSGLSGSIGASYQLPANNYIKFNMAKSYRAPSISELTSNQLDPANVFRLGDPNLKAEDGYEADIAYGNNGKDVSFEVDGFYNYINNFIFADRIAAKNGGDSMKFGAPVYKYTPNTAIITGIAAFVNIHPVGAKWFEFNNGFTYIYSYLPGQTDSTQHVPFTPAPRLTSEVKFKLSDKHIRFLKGTYFEIGLAKYWAQKDIYSALWNELPSDTYTLINAGIGTNFVNPRTKRIFCSLFINCTNLSNIVYLDHTSREQYFWSYNSVSNPTNFGANAAVVTKQSEGIYNMGRNVGIKLVVPIGGHKVSDAELHGIQ